jgi:hypothetical protein
MTGSLSSCTSSRAGAQQELPEEHRTNPQWGVDRTIARRAKTLMNLSVNEAAAPPSSLAFMFWGCGIVVFPLMLHYTIISLGYCDLRKPVV